MQNAIQLPAADNVKAASCFGHKFEDIYIAAGLDGITNRGIKLAVGLSNFLQMLLEGGFAVDINRRADFGDDSFNVYVFSK
ncbi:hypothetical protein ES703_73035 [subsurface metagenome]